MRRTRGKLLRHRLLRSYRAELERSSDDHESEADRHADVDALSFAFVGKVGILSRQ